MRRILNPRLLVAILLAASIIGMTMHSAIRRGMDHAVMIGPGDQTAIAISLSDTVYNLRLGYIGLKQVRDAIYDHWNRGASGWSDLEQLKKNFHDRDLLNAGLRAAASLGPQTPGYIEDGTLITTFYDDMGEVDYVTMAFRLFGLQIESMLYLYFTLVALSALVFILTFHDRIFALCLLFTTLFAYYVELYLKVFEPVAITSYWGMRHSSTLCFVPAFHLALLLLWKRKPSPAVVAGAVIQLAILILTWRIRGSVAWVLVFLPALAFALALLESWPKSAELWPRSWTAIRRSLAASARSGVDVALSWRLLVRRTLRWPVVLLLLGLLANNVYNRAALHPIYYSDDVMSYHGIWHSVHIGLAIYAPELMAPRVKKITEDQGVNDGTTLWTARDYLDRIHLIPWNGKPELVTPAPGYLSPWHGIGLKIAWHERTLRNAYFEKLKANPLRILQIYVTMPLQCIRQLMIPFAQAPTKAWLWLIAAAGAGVLVLLLGFARSTELGDGIKVFGVAAGALTMATLPNMIAYAAVYAMSDSILLVVTVLSAGLGFAAYALVRFAIAVPRIFNRAQV